MILIPLDNRADYFQTFTLEGFSYDIRLQYSPMRTTTGDGSWVMYIGPSGFPPVLQRKVVNGFGLLEDYRHLEGIPPGDFYVVDVEADYGRVDRDGFTEQGGRYRLVYLKRSELVQST